MSEEMKESGGLANQAEDECAACLLEVLGQIPDPRNPSGRRYAMASVLALATAASMAGCANPSRMFAFGRARPELLKRLGFEPPARPKRAADKDRVRCPNEDTIKSVCAKADPVQFNRALARFLGRMAGSELVASVDGKALRGSKRHVLTVFASDARLALWQEEVSGGKQSELSCLEANLGQLLERLPGLKLLLGDAAFCQKTIARELVAQGRDYLFCLKSPHKTDLAIANQAFDVIKKSSVPLARTVEKREVVRVGSKS
jgi:hypothetical protein